MNLQRRPLAENEFVEQSYSAEVLCSNWVAHPLGQPAAPARAVAAEQLREADTLTFLARIYASQRC